MTVDLRPAPTTTAPSLAVTSRVALAPLAKPDLRRSLLDLATSVVPYLATFAAMVALMDVSYLLVLALAVPAAGFLIRIFIVFHDCTHGSFLPGKKANQRMGSFVGLFVFANFQAWKHAHQVHHATAGDLDRRGIGDLTTMTVEEYRNASPKARLGYRLFRNPLVMFGVGPIWSMLIQPRVVGRDERPRIRRAAHLTNAVLALLILGVCLLIGWKTFLAVQGPIFMLAGAVGIWLFYVQHQFEDAYWESGDSWSYADAALKGSSYLKLPKLLQFFTGNIGLHHVHHLNARIPNYNLQRAHDEHAIFHEVPQLSLRDGLRSVRLKLWDAEHGRLIGWRELHRAD